MPTPRKYPNAAARQAAYRQRCREQVAGSRSTFPARPGRHRWKALCSQARDVLTQVSQEMEAYSDARSEAWQDSERGGTFQETREAVTQLAEELDEVSFG